MPHLKAPSGIEWYFDIEGEGEALLFIHGWGVDHRIWRQQTKYFSRYFKVVAIDLPGHGKSGWKKISLRQMAQDVHFILESNGINSLLIAGSSVGGLLALKLYDCNSLAIKKMSFVGSIPRFVKTKEYPYGLDIEQLHKLGGQLDTAYPSIVNIFFRSLFTKEERETRRFKWLQKFRQTDDTPMKEALSDYLNILQAEDLRHILKNVSVPVQFINGTHDGICNIQAVQHIKELLPSARFDYFQKCGHFSFLSKPYEFNAVLEDFLKS